MIEDLEALKKRTHAAAKAAIEREVARFGTTTKDALETRHWEKLDAILDATSREETFRLSARATTSAHTTLLSLWSANKIPGPQTAENYERKAKKAEGLVRMQVKKGNEKAAERQRQRVTELRAKAQQFREGQAPTPGPKKPKRRSR